MLKLVFNEQRKTLVLLRERHRMSAWWIKQPTLPE